MSDALAAPEAELSVLGSLILRNDLIPAIAPMMSPEMFTILPNRAIFRAILELHEAGSAVDLVTMRQKLPEGRDWTPMLLELVDGVPAVANVQHYVRLVREAWRRRVLILLGNKAAEDAKAPGATVDAVIADIQAQMTALLADDADASTLSASEAVDELAKRLAEAESGGGLVPTGIGGLDEMLGGFAPGRLTILASRPFVGKTCMALNLAVNVAAGGYGVVYFGLEQGASEVASLMLCMLGGPSPGRLARASLTANELNNYRVAGNLLRALPLTIVDRTRLTPAQVGALTRRVAKEPTLVIVDYLQLLSMDKRERREREVADSTRELKLLSRELKTHILLLSQLNRAPEARFDKVPRMSDLRESGAIEQDADNVLLIHRPNLSLSESERDEKARQGKLVADDYAIIFAAKNRTTGALGDFPLGWNSATLRFSDDGIPEKVAEKYGLRPPTVADATPPTQGEVPF